MKLERGGEGENRHDTCGDGYFRRVRKWVNGRKEKENMQSGKKMEFGDR